MGAEEQKALTAVTGWAQEELPKEHPDLPKSPSGPCPCAKPGAPLTSRVSSCRRSCLLHRKQNLAISRLQASHSTFWGRGVFTLLLWPKSSLINCNPGTLASSTPQVARTLLSAFPSSYHTPPCPPQRVEVASPMSPPQHLRQSKENSSNHPAASQLLIILISVPESYQPRKGKGPRSEKGTQDGWAVLSHPSFSISPLLPPCCLGSIWGKKEHFQITHLQKSYPTCLGKSSGARRPRGYMRTELDTVRLWPFS